MHSIAQNAKRENHQRITLFQKRSGLQPMIQENRSFSSPTVHPPPSQQTALASTMSNRSLLVRRYLVWGERGRLQLQTNGTLKYQIHLFSFFRYKRDFIIPSSYRSRTMLLLLSLKLPLPHPHLRYQNLCRISHCHCKLLRQVFQLLPML